MESKKYSVLENVPTHQGHYKNTIVIFTTEPNTIFEMRSKLLIKKLKIIISPLHVLYLLESKIPMQ